MKRFILLICLLNIMPTIHLFAKKIFIKATMSVNAPKINGILNDTVWRKAEPFTDFKTIEPEPGIIPSDKTEVRIIYDRKNLYIAVNCFTSNTNKISVNTLKYDQHNWHERGDDLIRILLDPFLDMRHAYVFIVNAKGARTDGLAFGEHLSTNWDGVWEARSKIHKHGWSTEIRIPFKTISFNPRLKTWGINVERYIPWKMEKMRMSGISIDSFFYNPAEAAYLEGIENIKQGKGITFKPYATLTSSIDYESNSQRKWEFNTGFEIYKNFAPNLVGVFTYNTDFAETEVDERRINLTRFPEFYPEKRSFFLEGSEIFAFGTGLHRTFVPFFSRSIGIYEEEKVPIDYGAKIYGKLGDTNLAILDVKTKSTAGLNAENFFAGRIYQNIFSQSKVGIIFTSGNPSGLGSNTLLGIDFLYSTARLFSKKNFSAGAWYVYNWNHLEQGDHSGYGFRLDYPNDLIDASIIYNYFGDALAPALGFLSRQGVNKIDTKFQYKPRPVNGFLGKIIRQLYFEFFANVYIDMNGDLESSRIYFTPLNFRTESGERFEAGISNQRDVLDEEFELSEAFLIPPESYEFTRIKFEFSSASHRMVMLNLEYAFGEYYSGDLSQLELGVSFKYKGNFSLTFQSEFLRGTFPQGDFSKDLYRLKADFFLNADLGIMSFVQYDDVSGELGANLCFRWMISPGNTIYLVYNKSWLNSWDPQSRFLPIQDSSVFKIQFTWRP